MTDSERSERVNRPFNRSYKGTGESESPFEPVEQSYFDHSIWKMVPEIYEDFVKGINTSKEMAFKISEFSFSVTVNPTSKELKRRVKVSFQETDREKRIDAIQVRLISYYSQALKLSFTLKTMGVNFED